MAPPPPQQGPRQPNKHRPERDDRPAGSSNSSSKQHQQPRRLRAGKDTRRVLAPQARIVTVSERVGSFARQSGSGTGGEDACGEGVRVGDGELDLLVSFSSVAVLTSSVLDRMECLRSVEVVWLTEAAGRGCFETVHSC